MKAVEFRDVTVEYENRTALKDVSFEIEKGEFVGIVGSNGSGKTTTLKAMVGLVKPVKGRIRVLGMDVRTHIREIRGRIGYVPQKTRINPKMPVLVKEVVLMGLYGKIGMLHSPHRTHLELVKSALRDVEMYDMKDEPFGHLSGGQQQRVYLARALAQQPEMMLLDEPTTGLDVASQRSIIELIARLKEERELTVLFVTHDVNSINHVTTKVMYLKNRLVAFGPPAEVCREDILRNVYDVPVKVVRAEGEPCVIVSDYHVH